MKTFWLITLGVEAAAIIGFGLYAWRHDWLFVKEFGEAGKAMLMLLIGASVAFDAVAGLVCLTILAVKH